MYTTTNYKSKKALKEDLAKGVEVTFFNPGMSFGPPVVNGTVSLEGPHYPKAHSWYAQAVVKDGKIVKVT